jgi:hypothetical protein
MNREKNLAVEIENEIRFIGDLDGAEEFCRTYAHGKFVKEARFLNFKQEEFERAEQMSPRPQYAVVDRELCKIVLMLNVPNQIHDLVAQLNTGGKPFKGGRYKAVRIEITWPIRINLKPKVAPFVASQFRQNVLAGYSVPPIDSEDVLIEVVAAIRHLALTNEITFHTKDSEGKPDVFNLDEVEQALLEHRNIFPPY